MGKNYIFSTSWDRITSLVPHGIELHAFFAYKMSKTMHNMRPYIGKE